MEKLEVEYPHGAPDVPTTLSNNEMVRRLKILNKSLQELGQDVGGSKKYTGLAIHLASNAFLTHTSREVRILVACCIADLLRIFAPDAPYGDPDLVRTVLLFLIRQLRGLDHPNDPLYMKFHYLLENLVCVKSLTIANELDDSPEIVTHLIKHLLAVVRPEHGGKIQNLMLDLVAPLLQEMNQVSNKLLDALFVPLVEPHKTQNREAYKLAKEMIARCEGSLEQPIQHFFSQMLLVGQIADSTVNDHVYELLYELFHVSREITFPVFPQLEFKLGSDNEKDRLDAVKLLGKLFGEEDSSFADDQPYLWKCYLDRFHDKSQEVRVKCIRTGSDILLKHPELREQISGELVNRTRDHEENVRYEAVLAITAVAKKDFNAISEELLESLKSRSLDKKFKVRKEALLSIATLYRKLLLSEESTARHMSMISWAKNKILNQYYQKNVDDMFLCEKLLHTCLVPYLLPTERRMDILLKMYCSIEERPVDAFNYIIRKQLEVRNFIRKMLELHNQEESTERDNKIVGALRGLADLFTDPPRTLENFKEFYQLLGKDARTLKLMSFIVGSDYTTKKIEDTVKELLMKVGQNTEYAHLQSAVKSLLERSAPLMIDSEGILILVKKVSSTLDGQSDVPGVSDEAVNERSLKLLLVLSSAFPFAFATEETLKELASFLRRGYLFAAEVSLQILARIGRSIEEKFPELFKQIIPLILDLGKSGSARQAKLSVRCIDAIVSGERQLVLFKNIFESMKTKVSLEDSSIKTALAALGTIALLAPAEFSNEFKRLVASTIVEKIILSSEPHTQSHNMEAWVEKDELSQEATAKVASIKFMVRWLLGLKSNDENLAARAIKMFATIIDTHGDIRNNGNISPAEMAHLRLAAACALLKLVSVKQYASEVRLEQFQILAYMICDECSEVRNKFAVKLHSGLYKMKGLPLEYMSVFSLVPLVKLKNPHSASTFCSQMKSCLNMNIDSRRQWMRRFPITQKVPHVIMPEYYLSYVIHLLSHYPKLKSHEDVPALELLRECLWFVLEPLLVKKLQGGNYQFMYKLFQDIKQTKDAQNPDDDDQNKKMWALADLGMLLVAYRTHNFVLKDCPYHSSLSKKFFVAAFKETTNTVVYLPQELIDHEKRTHGKSKGLTHARKSRIAGVADTSVANVSHGKNKEVTRARKSAGTELAETSQVNVSRGKSKEVTHARKSRVISGLADTSEINVSRGKNKEVTRARKSAGTDLAETSQVNVSRGKKKEVTRARKSRVTTGLAETSEINVSRGKSKRLTGARKSRTPVKADTPEASFSYGKSGGVTHARKSRTNKADETSEATVSHGKSIGVTHVEKSPTNDVADRSEASGSRLSAKSLNSSRRVASSVKKDVERSKRQSVATVEPVDSTPGPPKGRRKSKLQASPEKPHSPKITRVSTKASKSSVVVKGASYKSSVLASELLPFGAPKRKPSVAVEPATSSKRRKSGNVVEQQSPKTISLRSRAVKK